MDGIKLQNIDMLHLLWIVPVLLAAYIYAWQKRRRALALFIDAGILDRIRISVSPARRSGRRFSFL